MLEHFFGSKTRLKLLHIFFRSPGRSFYVRELTRLAETQLNAVRREINNLEQTGLIQLVPSDQVKSKEIATKRAKYYQLNQESPLFMELKALLLKARVVEEKELIEEIKSRAGSLKLFILTGCFTNEMEVETDMLLVGAIKPLVLDKIIQNYEHETQKIIRYTSMTETELKERREIGDKFLYSIFEAKHITAIDELHLN